MLHRTFTVDFVYSCCAACKWMDKMPQTNQLKKKKSMITSNWRLTQTDNMCYKRQGWEIQREREEEEEEEQATFQPAVTLMTPFITMCRLTSWQRHAAPDGGEGHSAIPTLHSSFVEGLQEGSCGLGRKRRGNSCVGAQLDWRCTGSALQGCPCPCALTAGGLNSGLTLPYQKP